MIRYELENVRDIIDSGFEYTIPESSLDLIEILVKEVGNPDYQKTPIFSIKSRKKKKMIKEISDEEWITIRQFQKTNIDKNANEMELLLDNIKKCLNKMTEKTYNSVKDEIFINIQESILIETSDNRLKEIWNVIYNVSSSNNFHLEIYVELIKELKNKYIEIKDYLYNNFNTYIISLNNIINNNKNIKNLSYDELCNYNLEKSTIESQTAFFVMCLRYNLIEDKLLYTLLCNLLEQFVEKIKNKEYADISTDILHIIQIILKNGKNYFNEDNKIKIENNINEILKIDRKENLGYNQKSKFILMDLHTLMKK